MNRILTSIMLLLPIVALTAAPTRARAEYNPVVVITLGGNSSEDIHGVVKEEAKKQKYPLELDTNWAQDSGDIRATQKDAQRIMDKIDSLVKKNGNAKNKLNLIVIGKSAGGVLAWNLFRLFYGPLYKFHRVALVMVDPHGSVDDDENKGTYCDRQDLWWPGNWSSDQGFFRVYDIFQQEGAGLSGASFPDSRVHLNLQIKDEGITHMNIPEYGKTRKAIKDALHFVYERKW
ncbi:MAG: hypothetical protein FJ109_21730 [Deltaproteobacteria bacterium]|nr:hypothetical protein [Deltaproteobacteria bacterium]